jgi:hypothetical protein
MNHQISPMASSVTGCFLSLLLKDKLGRDGYANIEIINDNALTIVRKRQLNEKRRSCNERQMKAQLHIASRWGDSQEVNHHDRHDDTLLRPIPRRSSELSLEEVTKKGLGETNNANATSFATGTIEGLDGQQQNEVGSKDIHSRCTSPWRYARAPLSELPFSEYDIDTIPGNEMRSKYTRILHITTKAVSISSASHRLPRRGKPYARSMFPGSVTTPTFIKQASASI